MKSCALKSRSLYPSRLKARTAFGPSQTLPSIRGVKCTPKKGNRGFGTLSHTQRPSAKVFMNMMSLCVACFYSQGRCCHGLDSFFLALAPGNLLGREQYVALDYNRRSQTTDQSTDLHTSTQSDSSPPAPIHDHRHVRFNR